MNNTEQTKLTAELLVVLAAEGSEDGLGALTVLSMALASVAVALGRQGGSSLEAVLSTARDASDISIKMIWNAAEDIQ